MPTTKQGKALEKMVENGGNVSRAMLEVGYSPNTAKTPQKLTQSKGYRDVLSDCGLTEMFIVSNLVNDIIKKPKKRLGELTLASDLLGLRKKALIIEDTTREQERDERSEEMNRELGHVIDSYLKAKLRGESSVVISVQALVET